MEITAVGSTDLSDIFPDQDRPYVRVIARYIRSASDEKRKTHLYARYWRKVKDLSTDTDAPIEQDSDLFEPVQALVFMCHGYGEHLEHYSELATAFCLQNWLPFGHDHVGHGKSDGERGFVESIENLVADVIFHMMKVRSEMPSGVPLFLYGHSMGGLVSLNLALQNPRSLTGVIFEGPLLQLRRTDMLWIKYIAAKWLSNICPRLEVEWISPLDVTSDIDAITRITNDLLWYRGGIPLLTCANFVGGCRKAQQQMIDIDIPFLVMHGENDVICQLGGSKSLYKNAESKDKSIIVFPDAKHHLILEKVEVRSQVIRETIAWIKDRVSLAKYENRAKEFVMSAINTENCDADQGM